MKTVVTNVRSQFSLQPDANAFPPAFADIHVPTNRLPKLALGEQQDVVELDSKDEISGYGRFVGLGATTIVHYDRTGEVLSRSITDNNATILVDDESCQKALAYRRNPGVQAYFDAGGDFVGEARLKNEMFVEYFDRSGAKMGVAIIEANRITYMDSTGRYMGRRHVMTTMARRVAMTDAWALFDIWGFQP